jgi:hypothetical protein
MTDPMRENNGNNYKTLPEVCMLLHLHHTGASDELSYEHYKGGVEYVRERVLAWDVGLNGQRWKPFDVAVLSLCVATL